MKKKETVHIISHSHWDREWYLSYEEHRMRLIELIDNLISLFQDDPDFKSFHLDGQSIVLDDYLEIRPQNREMIQELISKGKLIIGPYYILQDSFLITSEMHIRNSLIGHLESKKWGTYSKIGYFPDTFGNIGQIPQLLKLSDVDVAFFGRGVKPIGFNNSVLDDSKFQSRFSEMNWRGPDGSEVLGVLFSNWYSNGNEIPVDKIEAKKYWDKKLEEVRTFASTSHYLLMNGCDHQPVQKDLSQALRVARELYPDIEFVHDNLPHYIEVLKQDLPNELNTVNNELISQETDGWYTLSNTASSRIYLKQENDELANLLEGVIEPIMVITRKESLKDQLQYAWKLLLQNAPHDSICGCSVDEVHKEMEIRYQKVREVIRYLLTECLEDFENKLDVQQVGDYHFTVLNTSSEVKTELVNLEIVLDSSDFRDGQLEEHYKKMQDFKVKNYQVIDESGFVYDAIFEDLGVSFRYDLPKDKFRSAQFSRKLKASLVVTDMSPFSWKTFSLVESPKEISNTKSNIDNLENDFYKFTLSDTGHVELLLKKNKKTISEVFYFEDCGDVGNEYVFKEPMNSNPIYSKAISLEIDKSTNEYVEGTFKHELVIPVAMEEKLNEEQKQLIEFKDRTAQRSKKITILQLETKVVLYKNNPQIHFETRFSNKAKDHRVRVIFNSGIFSENHEADSIFELVTRSNKPEKEWENPSFTNRYRHFVSLGDEITNLTVSSIGLHEYEVLNDTSIALTLLRSIGELGDWGYFPTPDAQCQRNFSFRYSLEWHDSEQKWEAFHRCQSLQNNLLAFQVYPHSGQLPSSKVFLKHSILKHKEVFITTLKYSMLGDDRLIRYVNFSSKDIQFSNKKLKFVNILEEETEDVRPIIRPHEIKTEVLEDLR